MKKLGFLIPILLFIGLSTLVPQMFAAGGGANKGTLLLIIALFCFMAFSFLSFRLQCHQKSHPPRMTHLQNSTFFVQQHDMFLLQNGSQRAKDMQSTQSGQICCNTKGSAPAKKV